VTSSSLSAAFMLSSLVAFAQWVRIGGDDVLSIVS
jgi:hypothetical protein